MVRFISQRDREGVDILKYQKARAQPARAVRCFRRCRDKRGLGANRLEVSHTGNTRRHTTPTPIIAMILLFFQPFLALAASVSGTRMSVTAADRSIKPNMSRSYQVRRTAATKPERRVFLGLMRLSLRALRWFKSNESARGRKEAGKMIAHIP